MKVQILHSDARVEPQYPVELAVLADGEPLRVDIEWSTLEHLLGTTGLTADTVHEFVRHNRHAIEIAVAAHLFARGMPLARRVVLSRQDFAGLPGGSTGLHTHTPTPPAA